MILLFTSDHCAWCDVLKMMLDDESGELGIPETVFEVDVDRHHHIAEAYGILVVPTLVAGMQKISGVPTHSDLKSFLLQVSPSTQSTTERGAPNSVLREARGLRESPADEKAIARPM